MIVSVPNADKKRSGEFKQYTILSSLYVYADTNMAGTRIVCPIYTVYLGGARSDLVAWWLARQTLKPADQDRFLGGHLLNIVFLLLLFQLYNNELLPTSNIN